MLIEHDVGERLRVSAQGSVRTDAISGAVPFRRSYLLGAVAA